ncbi:MAG: hypothetical protein G01um101448_800 [Parcubacteria group bacterium Gr01-1014_48]|nr:MAG: hypothetical protein Greene041614_345 [Parcubacteria group bacterium Greene0416_14]TSC73348.1 MAG: hypothetical protein G01um101448_800 [Parcubacteria group bacterium Gr01-1014_48]TSD01313.1 MAG: hypothetical protein Greene101415_327 [Parcubacteria group bacterium Greene1014_15]TSD08000.1 MAG: hypothetical protein Greene07144_488 [Parcubacteria group bacterium Greene0714_4]
MILLALTASCAGGTTHRLTNDVATTLPVILTESGPEGTTHYVYGLGLISQTGPDFQNFYHYDGLGSVVNLTNSAGNHTASYTYDPWGVLKEKPASTVQNRFQFTGEESDDSTGLYYLRARWYDPSVGRFLSRDPIDEGGAPQVGHQRYAYAGNNPLTYVDPSGLTVYVASSRVASVTPFAHTYLIIEPTANTQQKIPLVFSADAPFRFGTAGALSYITISGYAGNVGELPWYVGGGRLPFTRGNLELFYGIEERNASVTKTLIAAPSGMTDTQFELLLLLAAESYRPVRYGATSAINYNSNSLTSGLLAAAGRKGVQIPGLDVGWGNPLPISLETSRIREILRVSGGQTQRMK